MVYTQSTTEGLQQVKKNLQSIYKELGAIEHSNKVHEKQLSKQLNKPFGLRLKTNSYIVNTTATTTAISEKEPDYKKASNAFTSPTATQYLLIDILREECLALQQKLIDTLAYNHLLTESNMQSIQVAKSALASANNDQYKLALNQLISPLCTQHLLIDTVREECLALQQKLIDNLAYIDLRTQSNAEKELLFVIVVLS